MNFIKLKDQVVSVGSIVKVEKPRKLGPIEWSIRTVLNSMQTMEQNVNSVYSSEQEAQTEYERIVKQLCADKD